MDMSRKNRYIPPADIILDLLNEEEDVTEAILDFYGGYIASASSISQHNTDGIYEGNFKDEDLMQDIRVAVIKALPPLRRKLKQFIEEPGALVIVIR